MSKNIVTAIQEKLGLSSFRKIDPNLEKEPDQPENSASYIQAAVITVLVGLYKYGSSNEGSNELLNLPDSEDLLHKFFGDYETHAVEAVSSLGHREPGQVYGLMEKVAQEAIAVVRQAVGENPSPQKVRTYITDQRHNILVFLPPELNLGKVVEDNTLDDRTNKMEGPVSGIMHFFEGLFAQKDKDKVS